MAWVLELNDAELTLSRDGQVLYREPGIASLAGRAPVFGNAALATARLDPRRSENQYFARMNAEPVTAGVPGVANQADLVYRHLCEIASAAALDGAAVHVVVPSASTAEQLGLLLGIAREAGIDVASLLDAAVASACTARLPTDAKILDVSLHRASIATLECTSTVRRVAVEEVSEAGVLRLVEGWVDAVADRFVAETRFDPLRIAAAEQQVFDQVHAAVSGPSAGSSNIGAGGELTVEVTHRGDARAVDLAVSALADKSAQRYEVLAQRLRAPKDAPATLALTHRAQRLPGLEEHLAGLGHEVIDLDADAARVGVEACVDALAQDDGIGFVCAVPVRHDGVARISESVAGTHLLCNDVAMPLRETLNASEHPEVGDLGDVFRVVRRKGIHYVASTGTAPVTLNGQPVPGEAPAAVGALIECGGRSFRIVRVVDG